MSKKYKLSHTWQQIITNISSFNRNIKPASPQPNFQSKVYRYLTRKETHNKLQHENRPTLTSKKQKRQQKATKKTPHERRIAENDHFDSINSTAPAMGFRFKSKS